MSTPPTSSESTTAAASPRPRAITTPPGGGRGGTADEARAPANTRRSTRERTRTRLALPGRLNASLQGRLQRAARWLGRQGVRPLAVMAQYRSRMGRWPRLIRSGGINDHLAWVRAFRRFDTRHVITADKYAVRDWVAERVGPQVLNELHQVFEHADELDFDALPDAFALKATHMAGGNCLVPDRNAVSRDELVEFCEAQLRHRFGAASFEDHYLQIPPRMIVESWLGSQTGTPPDDYKFYVFRGQPLIVLVGQGRHDAPSWTLFDSRWNRLRVGHPIHPVSCDIPQPKSLDRMLEIASTLGREFDFCRVDLYEVENRVVFGEITHTPAAGYLRHDPPEFDEVMGRLIRNPDARVLETWIQN